MSIKDKITKEYLKKHNFDLYNDEAIIDQLSLWDLTSYRNEQYPNILFQERNDRPGFEFFDLDDYGSPINNDTIVTEGDFENALMTLVPKYRIKIE